MAKKLNKKSATQIYNEYKEILRKKGLKCEWEDENGVIHTKYIPLEPKKKGRLKDFCLVYENVQKGIGLDNHSLEDSYEFAKQAIAEHGWETERGNIRKVSRKMEYLVFIYEDLNNLKQPDTNLYDMLDDVDILDSDSRSIGRTMAVMPYRSRGRF